VLPCWVQLLGLLLGLQLLLLRGLQMRCWNPAVASACMAAAFAARAGSDHQPWEHRLLTLSTSPSPTLIPPYCPPSMHCRLCAGKGGARATRDEPRGQGRQGVPPRVQAPVTRPPPPIARCMVGHVTRPSQPLGRQHGNQAGPLYIPASGCFDFRYLPATSPFAGRPAVPRCSLRPLPQFVHMSLPVSLLPFPVSLFHYECLVPQPYGNSSQSL